MLNNKNNFYFRNSDWLPRNAGQIQDSRHSLEMYVLHHVLTIERVRGRREERGEGDERVRERVRGEGDSERD